MRKTNFRRGFTMIELIFVIVIIGILASIASSKLAATRDDAKQVKAVQNLATCITDIGAAFTGSGEESTGTSAAGDDAYASCNAVKNDDCFTVTGVDHNSSDGNITVTDVAANTEAWCTAAQAQALKQKLSASGNGQIHSFGGSKVKF